MTVPISKLAYFLYNNHPFGEFNEMLELCYNLESVWFVWIIWIQKYLSLQNFEPCCKCMWKYCLCSIAPHSYYQHWIGILCWKVKLGRLDILHALSIVLQHLALPHEGHLQWVYGIFSHFAMHIKYVHHFLTTWTLFSLQRLSLNRISPTSMMWKKWKNIGPSPCWNGLGDQLLLGGADCADNIATCWLHTGIAIYAKNTHILWYPKRQSMVESSVWKEVCCT